MTIQELIEKAGIVELKETEIVKFKERGSLSKLLFEAHEKQNILSQI